jgi:uncharacterized metal-binding protein
MTNKRNIEDDLKKIIENVGISKTKLLDVVIREIEKSLITEVENRLYTWTTEELREAAKVLKKL